mgnify:CR=1 FL=1
MASLYRIRIQSLKGVGEKRAQLFQKLGASSVGALLRLYPRAYVDLSRPLKIREAPLDGPCAVRAAVVESPSGTRIRGGMTLYKGKADDGETSFGLTFFNNPYVPQMLQEGKTYLFYGRVNANFLRREMVAPEFFPVDSSPAILPVYPQTKGLSSRSIGSAVRQALDLLPETLRDPIPAPLQKRYSLCTLRFALQNIHAPSSLEAMQTARRRLIFEELLLLQLGLFLMKSGRAPQSTLRLVHDRSEEFFSLLPFSPTGAQRRAVRDAVGDMAGGRVMRRLIQGDVGSGKTAVAAALCYCAVKDGMQAALMAPTEILARQHYEFLSDILKPAGIGVALLTGSVNAARKRELLARLESGETGLVVGTHALLSKGVRFHRLGLVVTDEQHRFGVAQRASLAAKGDHPHLLVMSATPIPRTLALMIYGDLDLSVLDELPPGRRKVKTYAVGSDKRARVFAFLEKQIEEGHQCFIICPMIDEGPDDMASVNRYARELKRKWLPDRRIAVLHGKMKPREKNGVMRSFEAGEIDVLVSTTVVEVGIDVPNATVMLVENAERYGLSQLHQLRGRVGRSRYQSYCILISNARKDEALARLSVMCRTNDGFRIADEDLRLRGPGDFFGYRQHGLPVLKIASMSEDLGVLQQAQAAAKEILRGDPSLARPEHRSLRAEVRQLFATRGLAD